MARFETDHTYGLPNDDGDNWQVYALEGRRPLHRGTTGLSREALMDLGLDLDGGLEGFTAVEGTAENGFGMSDEDTEDVDPATDLDPDYDQDPAPSDANPTQLDSDGDGRGDECQNICDQVATAIDPALTDAYLKKFFGVAEREATGLAVPIIARVITGQRESALAAIQQFTEVHGRLPDIKNHADYRAINNIYHPRRISA